MARARLFVAAALLAEMAVLALAAALGTVLGEPLSVFTRDLTMNDIPPYAGAVSMLNGMVWASAGTLSLLVAALVPAQRRWLLLFGALLLAFAADDSLRLHEGVGPHLGIPELTFYVVYAVTGLVLLRGLLVRPVEGGTVAFLVGGSLLAASVLFDVLVTGADLAFAEDGLKLLGALAWLTVPPLRLLEARDGEPATTLATAGRRP